MRVGSLQRPSSLSFLHSSSTETHENIALNTVHRNGSPVLFGNDTIR